MPSFLQDGSSKDLRERVQSLEDAWCLGLMLNSGMMPGREIWPASKLLYLLRDRVGAEGSFRPLQVARRKS